MYTLLSEFPELHKQIHPSKNEGLNFDLLTVSSGLKIWWLGDCGHEWESRVAHRTGRNALCPFCHSGKFLTGFNDLATTHPDVAGQWHPEKNGDISPTQIKITAKTKIWWKCSGGHEWECLVSDRLKTGCPYCSGKRVLKGFNDLATTHPEVASQWHLSKNVFTFGEVTAGSQKKAWWQCSLGHEWEAVIGSRTKPVNPRGCPVCAGRKVLSGFNDLATLAPEVAAEWHPTKNRELFASNILSGTTQKVWWLGKDCNHTWEAQINNRVHLKSGCPFCAGKKILVGFNDFATTHPALASQLEGSLNPIQPTDFSYGFGTYLWWKCAENHLWQAAPKDRARGNGCPSCAASKFVSDPEQVLSSWLQGLGLKVATSVYGLAKNREIDIYLPELNVAIEYNGVYWHSEAKGKGKNYHYDKWDKCRKQGIHLIQIWEDEWNKNPELVKCMIAHKIGLSVQPKIYARKTDVVELTVEEISEFLEENHIQGAVDGGVRLGLKEVGVNGRLVAVMLLKRESGSEGKILNLLRFATSKQVAGGFTKLLKYVERTYNPESIVTFSDNCVSDGGLYDSNGFVAIKVLEPDYKYVVKAQRIHKFRYRLKRFLADPELKYVEGLSERELAQLNGLNRIWDAGKVKWEKKNEC